MKTKTYVTTPIYYPNANLHMGHAYTNIIADVIKRFNKLDSKEVFFSTGSDEHGQKIQEKALEAGKQPLQYVDEILVNFYKLWEELDIDYDSFNRTTNEKHEEFVKKVFTKLLDQGDIYKDKYLGYYCVSCETHYSPEEVSDDFKCPECGKDLKKIEEDSYFLRTSKYNDWIKEYLENTIDIYPANRKTELINNFLIEGLKDLSISRESVEWGIKIPNDEGNTIYVWFDALLNYLSGIDFDIESNTSKFWDEDTEIIHLMGKEITRFHCIYLPIVIKMLGARLPDKFIAHGWLITDSGKMSKSKGNAIDPLEVISEYGKDPVRFYFSNKIRLNEDSKFSMELLKENYNTNLVNLYGNTYSRTAKMISNLYGEEVPTVVVLQDEEKQLLSKVKELENSYFENMRKSNTIEANKALIEILREANKYIDITTPWLLKEKNDRISTILNTLFSIVYKVSVYISPVLVEGTDKFFNSLNVDKPSTFDEMLTTFENVKILEKVNIYDRKK